MPVIAQNGVQVAFAATALVASNRSPTTSTPGTAGAQSCGVLFSQADKDAKQRDNTFASNQRNVCVVKG